MAIAKITLIGLYQYMNDQNDPLFKNLTVPAGMDKDKLIETILYKGAEFGCLYADPYFMQYMIMIWSNRYYHTLERWSKALAIDYDPLENYDRHEEWLDSGVLARTGKTTRLGSEYENHANKNTGQSFDVLTSTSTGSGTNSNSAQQTTAGTKATDQTDDHKVSAYNESTYQNKDKTDTNSDGTDTTISMTNSNGGSTVNGSAQNFDAHQTSDQQTGTNSRLNNENVDDQEQEDHSTVHTGRLHGNIGVTTSQQMLQSELNIARFNLYDESADLFLSEFCIYVY